MAVRTRDEIMSQLKSIIGEEDTSDETLNFIQDVSDTLGNDNTNRITELEQQLADQDTAWRKKYRDAFFSGRPDETLNEPEEPEKPKSFSDLFKFD